jgi:hypothetical protein
MTSRPPPPKSRESEAPPMSWTTTDLRAFEEKLRREHPGRFRRPRTPLWTVTIGWSSAGSWRSRIDERAQNSIRRRRAYVIVRAVATPERWCELSLRPSTDLSGGRTTCTSGLLPRGGTKPALIQVFYNDEHALTLGCATPTNPVSPLSTDPAVCPLPADG